MSRKIILTNNRTIETSNKPAVKSTSTQTNGSSKWIQSTKKYAEEKNTSYRQALQDPINRSTYHSSQSIRQGMLPTYVPQPPVKDHSGYNPYQNSNRMEKYVELTKLYSNLSKKSVSETRYYL